MKFYYDLCGDWLFGINRIFRDQKIAAGPKTQNILEIIYEFIEDIIWYRKKDGRSFVTLIFTIFVFVLAAIGLGFCPMLPRFLGFNCHRHHLFTGVAGICIYGITIFYLTSTLYYLFQSEFQGYWYFGLRLEFYVYCRTLFDESMACWIISSYMGDICIKGGGYYYFPSIHFYLNVISEVSSVVSHSFRLFGNIHGGFMILVIVSSLVKYFGSCRTFSLFGLFKIVQAFVFTMLAVTYIGQKN